MLYLWLKNKTFQKQANTIPHFTRNTHETLKVLLVFTVPA